MCAFSMIQDIIDYKLIFIRDTFIIIIEWIHRIKIYG